MFRKPKVRHQLVANTLSLAVLSLFLAFECSAQTGASREAFKGSAEFRESVDGLASSIEKYAGQLEKTDRSLTRLSRSDADLTERYQSFARDLRKLEKAHKNTASEIETMRERETKYFTAWDKANMQIADPELRRSLARRRSEVMAKYNAVADEVRAIGRDLQPFMSHLKDLDLFLGTDPSRANLRDASEMIEVSRAESRSLRYQIADVQQRLKVFLSEKLTK